ncbi:MAG TPA: POTRA domain-containing protein [Rhodanobacter sp.]|jgi:hemolysin activation/secretion protein|nr:POTRA domain-containing protein [Rhodanobacter sp.]
MQASLRKAWLGWLAGSAIFTAHAQVFRPPTANPLQTLPRVDTPHPAPSVTLNVQTQHNPQLEALLARTITPTRIDIVGVHAIPFADAALPFKPLTGKPVRIGELVDAATAVTAIYKQRGYALSFAFLPNQDFAGGVVHVVVVEGYVAEVNLSGEPGTLTRKVRMIAGHISHERPLRTATFERYIQVLGLLPGVHITANVPAPTTTDGATRLELHVTRQRFSASAGIDFNHPGIQGLLTAVANALTPLGEQWSVSALYPPGHGDQQYYAGAFALPLGSDGLGLKLDGSRYRGNPGEGDQLPSTLQRRLKQDRIALTLSYPLLLGPNHSLIMSGGAYGSNGTDRYRNTLNDAQLELQSDVRVLQASLDDSSASMTRQRKFGFGVARGIDGWGARSRTLSNVPGNPFVAPGDVSFTRFDANFVQIDQWPARFGSSISLAGQYSHNRLPSTEQISFGGPRYALAYDPGVAAGDSGWGAALELNRSYAARSSYLKSVVPYAVVQLARVYVNRGSLPVDQLGSAALGLRLSDNKHYSIDLSIAQPFGDKPPETNRRRPRANLGFAYQLP